MTALYNEATLLQEDMDKVSAVMAYTATRSGDAAEVEEYKAYLANKYGLDQKAIDQYAIAGGGGAYVPRTCLLYTSRRPIQKLRQGNQPGRIGENGYPAGTQRKRIRRGEDEQRSGAHAGR